MSLRKRRTEFIPLLSKDDNPKIKQQLKRNEFRSTAGPAWFVPFDELHAVRIYQRNLPHWRQDGCTYFVTFQKEKKRTCNAVRPELLAATSLTTLRSYGIPPGMEGTTRLNLHHTCVVGSRPNPHRFFTDERHTTRRP
jgi:hypothetical protein